MSDYKEIFIKKDMKKSPQVGKKKMMIPKKTKSFKPKGKKKGISDNPRRIGSNKGNRGKIDHLYCDDDAKISVMDRADDVMTNIPANYPCFLKHMLPSNVSFSFWMFLPPKFCKTYLPREDSKVILVDECGEERETKYLVNRHGLSAGWRGFAIKHRLRKGDILVFHLISPCKFKVNIVRVYGLDVVDAAHCLMDLNPNWCTNKSELIDNELKSSRTNKKARKSAKMVLPNISPHTEPHNDQGPPNLAADQPEIPAENFEAEFPEVFHSEITAHQQQFNEQSYRGDYLIPSHFTVGVDCR